MKSLQKNYLAICSSCDDFSKIFIFDGKKRSPAPQYKYGKLMVTHSLTRSSGVADDCNSGTAKFSCCDPWFTLERSVASGPLWVIFEPFVDVFEIASLAAVPVPPSNCVGGLAATFVKACWVGFITSPNMLGAGLTLARGGWVEEGNSLRGAITFSKERDDDGCVVKENLSNKEDVKGSLPLL